MHLLYEAMVVEYLFLSSEEKKETLPDLKHSMMLEMVWTVSMLKSSLFQ